MYALRLRLVCVLKQRKKTKSVSRDYPRTQVPPHAEKRGRSLGTRLSRDSTDSLFHLPVLLVIQVSGL